MLELVQKIDFLVEQYIFSIKNSTLDSFFYIITQFGGWICITVLFLLVCLFLWKNNRHFLHYFVWFFVINEVLTYVIKIIVGRLRPLGGATYLEFSGSMPSGHATASIFLYGYICFLLTKYYRGGRQKAIVITFSTLLILLIGFSRLYLDVHYLCDVIVGFAIGGMSLCGLVHYSPKNEEKIIKT